jgi:hypothetical protein
MRTIDEIVPSSYNLSFMAWQQLRQYLAEKYVIFIDHVNIAVSSLPANIDLKCNPASRPHKPVCVRVDFLTPRCSVFPVCKLIKERTKPTLEIVYPRLLLNSKGSCQPVS